MSLDIPLLIVIGFLLATLVMFFYSYSASMTTFREYAVGRKQFSTFTLVATILAAYYTGGVLRYNITYIADDGTDLIANRIIIAVVPFLILSWLAGRMSGFMYNISMAETMGRVYGKCTRLITALFEVCNSIFLIAMQIRIISDAIAPFITSVNPLAITMLVTLILVVYSIFGGIRAITFTDVLQSITFVILIAILAWLTFKKTNKSFIAVVDFLRTQKQFELHNICPFDQQVPTILRYLSAFFGAIVPYLTQNVYMAANATQAKKAFLYSSIFSFVIIIAILLVSIFVFIWLPDIPSKDVWHYFVTNTSPVLRGLVCVILLAMAMSTVDSRLHVCGIMFAYDIPKSIPWLERLLVRYTYQLARIVVLTVAILAMVLAFYTSSAIGDRLLIWYGRFYIPMIISPFILAVLGFRTTSLVAVIGMATGLLSVFVWQQWVAPIVGTNSGHVPCMLINGLAMIIANYLLTTIPKGRKTKKQVGLLQVTQRTHTLKNSIKDNIG